MTFFYDLNKRLAAVNDAPETKQLNERDMGKHNNATTGFKALAKKAGGGEKGERIAGAQFQKMKKAGQLEETGMDESAFQAAIGKKKYGDEGMKALQKAGRDHASDKTMSNIRNKYDKYDEGAYQAGPDKSQIPAVNRPGNRMTLQDLEKERTQSPTSPEGLKRAQQRLGQQSPIKEKMNPAKAKSFAALAPPTDKITFADKIAGAKKEVDEMLGDVAAEAMKSALSGGQKKLDKNDNGRLDANDFAMLRKGGKQKTAEEDDNNPFTNFKKPRADKPRVGDVEHGSKHDIEHTKTGRKVTRRVDDQGNSVGSDTDDEGNARDKRSRGRPKGPAKGTERVTSKAIKHKGEREKKGSAGSVSDSGKALQGFMIGNKPKNEPGKVSVRNKMKEGDNDPTNNDSGELKAAMTLLKKAGYKVSKSAEKESTADRDDHAEQAGKKFTKDVEAAEKKPKKKEKTEEAGGSGTPTASSGFSYGQGIYDSLNRDLENAITESMSQLDESMSINMSDSTEGGKSLTITASDEDALKLATLLKSAGLGGGDDEGYGGSGYKSACGCGTPDCSCGEEEIDEVSMNEPDYPTNTETGSSMQYSGGLDGPKSTGQSTLTGGGIPNLDADRQHSYAEAEEDALHRMMEMAGVKKKEVDEEKTAEGNLFTKGLEDDNVKVGDKIPGTNAVKKKDIDEGILASTRALWKKYQD
jgi:hypothetical protein